MNISDYLKIVNERFQNGISREHSYRADLEQLIRSIVPDVDVTNEPANVTDCGNPDYVISKKKIPIGYIEAKDIGKDLNSKSYKEQFTRYKNALDNLIITDYIWFQFFQHGELVFETRIAEIEDTKLVPLEANFKPFENQIKDFCTHIGQTIKSSHKLAQMMASKARLFQNVLEKATTSDEETEANTSLKDQYQAFKEILIHDITPKAFADIYAQTLTYGMFAARLHDTTLDDFSRQEAAELIPKSNPFLRKLFQYIAGYDIDPRIITPVENLAEVFRATNLRDLLADFGKSTQQNDPIVHFYETFLAEYDPKLRKARGVWYTPEPVVKFIVRAVDDILKTEFDIKDGLADTSKTKIKVRTQSHKKAGYTEVEQEVHKVQILDPATGTGTFLAEVIKYIYEGKFKAMQGVWSSYVEKDLIPRLNGFELLMASYAMAHLKLDLLLQETGYKAKKEQRLKVFLTNSLEEAHPDTGTLFANWLSTEANEANQIKRDTPVMCVIGNPPYAVSSTNKGDWIQNLIADYKKDLNERKINIDDDYIKFIRYGQHFIDKNGSGVLAYISSNSFLDGVTHRQMRKNLLSSFNKIYILDLHGNSKKKEVAPDGSADQNIFDIMTGVSINIFIKTKDSKALGKVFHTELYGIRENKYNFLDDNSLKNITWDKIEYTSPYYFFIPKDFSNQNTYEKGFKLSNLFTNSNTGIQTKRDALCLQSDKSKLKQIETDFLELQDEEIRSKYNLVADNRDWKISYAREDLSKNKPITLKVSHRPFDNKWTLYTGKSKGFIGYPRDKTMKHMLMGSNYALLLGRQNKSSTIDSFFITRLVSEMKCAERTIQSYHLPLYLYYDKNEQQTIENEAERKPNLDKKIAAQIADGLGLTFTNEKETTKGTFAPIDILDYIYAVLHSPTYREKYKEFLKIDFPRVPYPKDTATFWQLVKLGGEIRQIHLLESPKVEQYITTYPEDGDNIITRKLSKNNIGFELTNEDKQTGKVWINDEQYFDGVPLVAWNFYIGGYQPAQKWLKDRRERELSFDDILHYQKIIVALTETDRLMKKVDKIDFE